MIIGYLFFWLLILSVLLRVLAEIADHALIHCPYCDLPNFRNTQRCTRCGGRY